MKTMDPELALAKVGWTPGPVWSVPTDWVGERCFIICGGESVKAQRKLIPRLQGRVIAIKQSVVLRPTADVMFFCGEETYRLCKDLIPLFTGTYYVTRGRSDPRLPADIKRLGRTKDHAHVCETTGYVAGRDAGTSAINLAYQFGATEIILLGYDMCGGRWFNGEIPHFMPKPPESHFQRHMEVLPPFAEDLKAKGVRVVNCSPISRVECFEKQPLGAFL